MRQLFLGTLLLLFIPASNASAQSQCKPTSETDKFTGITRTLSSKAGTGFFNSYNIRLMNAKSESGDSGLFLIVNYDSTQGWAFIGDVYVLADSTRIILPSPGRANSDVRNGGHVYEWQVYPITEDQIRQIYNARQVAFRVSGERRNGDFERTPSMVCGWAEFAKAIGLDLSAVTKVEQGT